MEAFRDIFGGPWGTLGGPEGENLHVKNVLQKLDIRKVFFREFLGKLFSARVVTRWGHLGIFGGHWGTLGGPKGDIFT